MSERIDPTVTVARRFGIDTRQEPVIFLRTDSPVARSEGFEAMSRVNVQGVNGRSIIATLVIVDEPLLPIGQAGLSNAARRLLEVQEGDELHLSYPRPVTSLAHVRAKIYGNQLDADSYRRIIADIVAGRYMDVHLAAFITACANGKLSSEEIVHLTNAMVAAGERITWPGDHIVDKHSVGGLPGNRTTPIVVPIVAAHGLIMPKTSSRAITSPAGTADTMETLAPVDLDLTAMRQVVEKVGACIVWGGSVSLSPADDILIRVERALDVDSEGQLIASVLSKKIAAGATDVVIDLPVGPTAKVRSQEAAEMLCAQLKFVGEALGINVSTVVSEGLQPVGRGIGPALEARDVLAVLQRQEGYPDDLEDRATTIAGALLETAGVSARDCGKGTAAETLKSGLAWEKFQAICEAQGGLREPPQAPYRYDVFAPVRGTVSGIDNRVLARIAKLAGAPADKAAGIEMNIKLGDRVSRGDVLMIVHAESPGELEYALEFARARPAPVVIEED